MKLITTALLLVSSLANATPIDSIKVFYTDKVHVIQDVPLNGNQKIEMFNMDDKNNSSLKLNAMMKRKVQSKTNIPNYEIAYMEAFDEVLNGLNWDEIYFGLEKGSLAIVTAMQLKIQKTPAIVINETSVIYGVTSLKEAVRIYNKKVQ